ncbi:uncharacterized protein LOC131891941 [Tigriopus californicus]|uniref:uncharacterized protein LOC131891941 n=1 Tax=Tigriopus californicus TaxID=6832 RepID=UPI0027DA9A99|nr:uncharacterized protein LOC131891941 [Tigriopus californicus]
MFSKGFLIGLILTNLADLQHVSGVRFDKNSMLPGYHRQKRLFSLFNIVQFQNGACSAVTSLGTTGTCLSAQECSAQEGTSDGNCGSGFGVCCIFAVTGCGGTLNRNCTYIRNMGFPGADTDNGRTCSVILDRIADDICQIRLDFQETTNIPLGTNAGSCGGTGDSLTVISPHSTSVSAFPPAVCGILTGQHMYFESGRMGDSAGQVNILQGTGTADRRYNIKVSFIHCNSLVRAPSGCTQYFTGRTGTITSYNFPGGQLLGNQNYANCIRQREGYCSVEYSETQITSPDPFDLDANSPSTVSDNCMNSNFITIPSTILQNVVGTFPELQQDVVTRVPSMRCNTVFGGLPGTAIPGTLQSLENVPFVMNVLTRPSDGNGLASLTGFSLDYTQLPC